MAIKHKKTLMVIVVLFLTAVCVTAGFKYWSYQEKVKEEIREEDLMLEKLRDIQYAEDFGMLSDNNLLYRTDYRELFQEEGYKGKEIIFVLEEPAIKDEEHLVIYLTDHTEIYLENYNEYISRENINLAQFGLTYPITMEDICSKRDEIRELMDNTDDFDKNYVIFIRE